MVNESLIFDEEKTRHLILYLASKADIGKTKLMRLLYLIDFTAYEKTGKSITNDTYEHSTLGPLPRKIWKQCDELLPAIANRVSEARPAGKYIRSVPRKNPDLSIFTQTEREVIDGIVKQYGTKIEQELGDMVRGEFPYRLTKKDEVIPYYLATYRNHKKLTPAQIKKLRADKGYMKRLRDAYKLFKKEQSRQDAV